MARSTNKAGKAPAKTVTDLRRGRAVDDHQVPVDGDDGDDLGANFSPDGETLAEYLDECVRIFDEKKELDERIRNKTSGERDLKKHKTKHIATMEKRLAGDGYGLKSLQARKRVRIKRHEADLVSKELDAGQLRDFKRMERAERDFASTALGQAAEARESTSALN